MTTAPKLEDDMEEETDGTSFDLEWGRWILQVVSVIVLAVAAIETALGVQASEDSARVEQSEVPAPRILRDFQGVLQLVICASAFFGVHRHYRAGRVLRSVLQLGVAFLYVPMIPVLSMHPAWIGIHAACAAVLSAEFVADLVSRRAVVETDQLRSV